MDCLFGALNLKFADSGTTPFTYCSPKPPFTCDKTQTLHQRFSAMCPSDPRVAGFHYKGPPRWMIHWLVSIRRLNVCKPVRRADGKDWLNLKITEKNTLGSRQHVAENYRNYKKAGVTEQTFLKKM